MKLDEKKQLILAALSMSIIATSSFLAAVYYHDNPGKITSIEDINRNLIPVGTNVTVKGEILEILHLWMGFIRITITDGCGNLTFGGPTFDGILTHFDSSWKHIIVSGTVSSNSSLDSVSSIERVILFT